MIFFLYFRKNELLLFLLGWTKCHKLSSYKCHTIKLEYYPNSIHGLAYIMTTTKSTWEQHLDIKQFYFIIYEFLGMHITYNYSKYKYYQNKLIWAF